MKSIILNGLPRRVEGSSISYEQIVDMAYPNRNSRAAVLTVFFMSPTGAEGTIGPNESLFGVVDGLVLNAMETNRA
jgi:hypothetical protein